MTSESKKNDRAEQHRERTRQALERFEEKVRQGKGPRPKRPGGRSGGGR